MFLRKPLLAGLVGVLGLVGCAGSDTSEEEAVAAGAEETVDGDEAEETGETAQAEDTDADAEAQVDDDVAEATEEVVAEEDEEADESTEEAPTGEVTIDGDHLEPMPDGLLRSDEGDDPVVGTVAPTLTGTTFDGTEVSLAPDGVAKVIYFVAHWCPHCQVEVPMIQSLIDAGSVPEELEIYAVSTAYDSGQGNPPAEWLKSEGFSPITLRDDAANQALASFGGTAFPFAVYLDGGNNVVARSAGSLDPDSTLELWELAAGA